MSRACCELAIAAQIAVAGMLRIVSCIVRRRVSTLSCIRRSCCCNRSTSISASRMCMSCSCSRSSSSRGQALVVLRRRDVASGVGVVVVVGSGRAGVGAVGCSIRVTAGVVGSSLTGWGARGCCRTVVLRRRWHGGLGGGEMFLELCSVTRRRERCGGRCAVCAGVGTGLASCVGGVVTPLPACSAVVCVRVAATCAKIASSCMVYSLVWVASTLELSAASVLSGCMGQGGRCCIRDRSCTWRSLCCWSSTALGAVLGFVGLVEGWCCD